MQHFIKFLLISLVSIISFPFLLIAFILGIFAIDDFFNPPVRPDKKTLLLETKLPNSATEMDYYFSHAIDGIQGSMCAKIPKADFLKFLQELKAKGTLIKIKTGSGVFENPFEDGRLTRYALKCWDNTNPNNLDTYELDLGHGATVFIRYENGKIFVVRHDG